ncbi:hypothetical protein M409DRAFT_37246 [Zasmidium cellare ATCC 36951]|uniref:Major facilitator superfamily (MFS) profile domain-containing protein n=1 Tax=Zasmidium cellare ATCC 36951 TaxID=1080233 RepID=A0A6A6C939_ZASCE|nr:uncharacterized protein M409DRAFT_37246 [Zasmidium cellare ATCC 36951]KAF2163545.1 hypothetical protein M409DRAFT_37246 [Zasmidium cellare ATCC 36951]
MGFSVKDVFARSPLAQYGKTVRTAPREMIFNRRMILTAMLYATCAVPLSKCPYYFGIDSGNNASAIKNFVSLPFLGSAAGAALSFLLNDKLGRLWSFRVYVFVYTIGQMIAVAAPNTAALYAARVVTGLGIGALTVTGPMSLAEIAPAEIRGIICAWFPVAMGLAHFCAVFSVYGITLHVAPSRLQYQINFFVPCIYLALWVIASFFLCESPRWLFLTDKPDQAVRVLYELRGLPMDSPRLHWELEETRHSMQQEASTGHSYASVIRETFTKKSNLRRVQQVLICYALPQISGANTISSYFIPILEIIGVSGSGTHKIFLTGMYTMARFFFALITSFFLIDALGRRKSLFLGITLQMIGDIYIGAYLKVGHSEDSASSQAAIAMIFIHSFGYSAGLLTLPYVFGGELWPNGIRSFGAAFGQTFHWLFSYAMNYALPSLLDATNNWGAFIFFASWCFTAMFYVFFVVPEIAGLSVEEIEQVFRGPWFTAWRSTKHPKEVLAVDLEGEEVGRKG